MTEPPTLFPITIEWWMKELEELANLRSQQRQAYREKRDRLRKQQQDRDRKVPHG